MARSARNALRIVDTTLRDGHQSLLATRTRTDDMLPIAEDLDQVGFHALEVWGGATFDVTTRFLNEDPWERLAALKKRVRNTPLQMLLRGQNLVGYRHYADDVVKAFVYKAADVGIDIFRVFDSLNDERNFITAFEAIKETGKHIQGTISFSLTERRLGGRIYNLKYYTRKAKKLEDMGADSICIKDMAGILAPGDAYKLVEALKKTLKVPINLHCHYTSGMASMTYLKAVEAGVDIVDCAFAPFALRTSQPAVEPLVAALHEESRDPQLDLSTLFEIGQHFEKIAPRYREYRDDTRMSVIDTAVLMHQVPGGMLSNLVNQLREADALDRIQEVYEELPKVRADLGWPPLVTPSSQIVGTQAVMNVLFGRYKMISAQVKDYAYGLYGKPPVAMDAAVQALCLKGYERGEEPITCRPGDVIEPEMEKAREDVKGLAKDEADVLIYALYPTTGKRFLEWKYGVQEPPDDVKGRSLDEIERQEAIIRQIREGKLTADQLKPPTPEPAGDRREFNVFLQGEKYRVEVEAVGDQPVVRRVRASAAASPQPARSQTEAATPAAEPEAPEMAEGETAITAPMPGIVVEYKVGVGDKVKSGQILLVLEAMKMENELKAPKKGTVKEVPFESGASVEKGAVLMVLAE